MAFPFTHKNNPKRMPKRTLYDKSVVDRGAVYFLNNPKNS
jgi:hypothetical protein